MSRHATTIHLTPDERVELERRIRARTSPQQAVLRAQIILRAAAGARTQDIAAALGVVRHTVQRWRDRFAGTGPSGRRRSSCWPASRRPPWGGRARRTGRSWTWPSISASIPNSTWAPPARVRSARSSRRPTSAWTAFDSWMDERDPDFVAKAVAIIELELQPPTDGPTFCVDEKTGIGVREPAAPSQPAAPGQPARREFEYVRHGTADLLAAFCVQTGQVSGIVRPRHRAREFIELLRLLDSRVPRGQIIHLILDPVRMHCSAEVAVYVYYHPDRFQFHWLPKHASWLSFIEVWFAILSKKCLKRSEWAHFAAAEQTIMEFIATYNTHQAHPFTWRKGIRFYQRLKDKLAEAAAGAAEVA
jgi:DDE superfamily endonuclease/Homeodomain-like domain